MRSTIAKQREQIDMLEEENRLLRAQLPSGRTGAGPAAAEASEAAPEPPSPSAAAAAPQRPQSAGPA